MGFGQRVVHDEVLHQAFALMEYQHGYLYNRQLLLEMVETMYGIHDHRLGGDPFGLVTQRACETYHQHYLYEHNLELYLHKHVHKYLGLSFDEFLERPRYEIEKMISTLSRFLTKESSITQEALSNLQQSNAA